MLWVDPQIVWNGKKFLPNTDTNMASNSHNHKNGFIIISIKYCTDDKSQTHKDDAHTTATIYLA